MTTELKVSGMMCGACAGHVSKALQNVPGVQSVEVDLAAASARVEHNGADTQAMVAAIDEEGYTAQVVQ